MVEIRRQPLLGRTSHVHMVGVGGIGMSSIAEVLLRRGYRVTGSDLKRSEITDRLESIGAVIYEGHSASNLGDADVVVHSSAVDRNQNPETLEAGRRRIPIIKRADMLGELMRTKYGVAIAGTHGKTTTTTMAGLVVARGGFDPTIIVGGKVAVFGSSAVVGEGDIIVIEADEYDRAFLRLTPSIAVITSIDEEHLDIYEDLADIKASFIQFASSVPFFGAAIMCLDDDNVQSVVGEVDRRIVTYGVSRQADVRAENLERSGLATSFDVLVGGESVGRVKLAVPGLHNVRNALAAIAVGLELDIPISSILLSLRSFTGVQRRFEILATIDDVVVVNDYAHHPVEVDATLRAASQAWPDRRILSVFQPHLYSRTRDFKEAFARAFLHSDVAVFTDVYGAREEPIAGIDGSLIADDARRLGHSRVHYEANVESLPGLLRNIVRPRDAVVFMGAGDIWRYASRFVESLRSGLKETRRHDQESD